MVAFHNGRVNVWEGDCRDVLAGFEADSFDSCVTDPPYHFASIIKRFAKTGGADRSESRVGAYARHSKGFMNKRWDGGQIAHEPATWAAVLRVLKPGAHLVAFHAPKNWHRLAVAIEDAGFEIRDNLLWLFGSGFPKSHDVSKAIDRRKDWAALPKLQNAIKSSRISLGISQSEAARRMGLIGPGEELGGGGFMWFETGMRMPTREQWPKLKHALGIGDGFDACFEEAEREVTGTVEEWTNRSNYALTSKDGLRRDKPATDLARQWAGFGTALKPAYEPIVLARKPLAPGNTIAANVMAHGTGAINVDACRVATGESTARNCNGIGDSSSYNMAASGEARTNGGSPLGRWPANVAHDGSDEVVSAFPETDGSSFSGPSARSRNNGLGLGTNQERSGSSNAPDQYGDSGSAARFFATFPQEQPRGRRPGGFGNVGSDKGDGVPNGPQYGDSGSPSRFFYTAKADASDRIGSKHPTVKPLDLIQWLCRLITPPRGLILDPFAGTGTTAEAALREGFRCTLIEREPEYLTDIERRMALVYEGETGRSVAMAKLQPEGEPLPLFAEAAP